MKGTPHKFDRDKYFLSFERSELEGKYSLIGFVQ